MSFYVYIVANKRSGTIYIGMTDDLHRRVSEQKSKVLEGFTSKYGCDKLVWFEEHDTHEEAFRRERQIKEWRRSWKLMLIEEDNPIWTDLYESLSTEVDAAIWVSNLGI